jgi:hypothetical protein
MVVILIDEYGSRSLKDPNKLNAAGRREIQPRTTPHLDIPPNFVNLCPPLLYSIYRVDLP